MRLRRWQSSWRESSIMNWRQRRAVSWWSDRAARASGHADDIAEGRHERMRVPLNDVGRRIQALRPQLDEALSSVLDSGWYVMGRNHDALENELAAYLQTQHVLLVANGTDALQLALTALEVGPGDLVLSAANAGGYTSIAAAAIGATPVYADIDPATMLVT